MKKLIVCAMLIVALAFPASAQAQEFEFNGIGCYWYWSIGLFGWETCYRDHVNEYGYVDADGYGYHWLYATYDWYWWYVWQYEESHYIGWCYNDPTLGCNR